MATLVEPFRSDSPRPAEPAIAHGLSAPSPVPRASLKHRIHDQNRGSVAVSLAHLDKQNDNPIMRAKLARYKALIAEIDVNGDGQIDQYELVMLMDKLFNEESRSALFKGFALIMVAFSVLVIGAVFGLSFAVMNLTKEVQTKDGALLDKSGNIVMTYTGAPSVQFNAAPETKDATGRRLLQVFNNNAVFTNYNLKAMFGMSNNTNSASLCAIANTEKYVSGVKTSYSGNLCFLSTASGLVLNPDTNPTTRAALYTIYKDNTGALQPGAEGTEFGVWMARGMKADGTYDSAVAWSGSSNVRVLLSNGAKPLFGMTWKYIGKSLTNVTVTYGTQTQKCFFGCTSDAAAGYRASDACYHIGCINIYA